MDDFRKAATKIHYMIGGWNCPCCGPHGADEKQMQRQMARRRLKRLDERMVNEELDPYPDLDAAAEEW